MFQERKEKKLERNKIFKLSEDIKYNPIIRNREENEYRVVSAKKLKLYRKELHKYIFKQLPTFPINTSIQIMAKPIIRCFNKLSHPF